MQKHSSPLVSITIYQLIAESDEYYENACKEAVKWFHKAAEQGNAYAQFRLGNCYGLAFGVRYSEDESYKWYRKAADQGLAEGQCAVALRLRCGSPWIAHQAC